MLLAICYCSYIGIKHRADTPPKLGAVKWKQSSRTFFKVFMIICDEVQVNIYGDKATQVLCVQDDSFNAGYQEYLNGYELAENKAEYNAKYFANMHGGK